jgi:hypothetical protein
MNPLLSDPSLLQTDSTRCWSCKKKVGLVGIKCYCGYIFCHEHRYSDKHLCDFDFKKLGQAQVAKANPKVEADKVAKI